jgi:general secretion pathway protein I
MTPDPRSPSRPAAGRRGAGICGGFTLLEVLAALAVAAIGLAAVAQTVETGTSTSSSVSERTVATWVASNHLEELALSGDWPAGGLWHETVDMGGRRWYLERESETTADPDLVKVTVEVFTDEARRHSSVREMGYLARFAEPEATEGG